MFWTLLAEANYTPERIVINLMPLSLANMGEENIIKKVGGSPELKKHLEDIGFVVGGVVAVINKLSGNVIVSVKGARVAISEEMARRIMI